jgi:hypothetical protein
MVSSVEQDWEKVTLAGLEKKEGKMERRSG